MYDEYESQLITLISEKDLIKVLDEEGKLGWFVVWMKEDSEEVSYDYEEGSYTKYYYKVMFQRKKV